MNLEQLKQQEKELMVSLSENRNKQRELNEIAFLQKYGIDIGDTVEWTDIGILKRGVISEVKFVNREPMYLKVKLLNTDGTVGKRYAIIWSDCLNTLKIIAKNE